MQEINCLLYTSCPGRDPGRNESRFCSTGRMGRSCSASKNRRVCKSSQKDRKCTWHPCRALRTLRRRKYPYSCLLYTSSSFQWNPWSKRFFSTVALLSSVNFILRRQFQAVIIRIWVPVSYTHLSDRTVRWQMPGM